MKTILLTGASGFVGGYLYKKLVADGYHVVGSSNKSLKERYRSCDLQDAAQVLALVNDVNPDIVIHCAALSSVTISSTLDYYQLNVIASENLFKAIDTLGKRCRVLFLSTAGVYGIQGVECLSEDLCPKPVSHYGCSKFVCERMLYNLSERHDITILRPFNIIGYGQNEDFIVPKIIKHFAEKSESITLGDLRPQRDYIGIDLCCEIICKLIFEEKSYGHVVNVCSGTATSPGELIDLLVRITGHQIEVLSSQKYIRSNEILKLIGSTEKLASLLPNMLASENLEAILTEMLGKYLGRNNKTKPEDVL